MTSKLCGYEKTSDIQVVSVANTCSLQVSALEYPRKAFMVGDSEQRRAVRYWRGHQNSTHKHWTNNNNLFMENCSYILSYRLAYRMHIRYNL